MRKSTTTILFFISAILFSSNLFAHECSKYIDSICAESREISSCDKDLIKDYTGALYIPVNEHLRKINVDKTCLPIVKNLLSILQKIPVTGPKIIYRGVRRLDSLKSLKTGDCFTDLAFVSTTAIEAATMDFIRYEPEAAILKIKSKTGRDISQFSDYPEESEVLLLPNTLLKFEKKETVTDRIEKYHFKEVSRKDCSIIKK
ncbi:MAG: ADP-ribosyltransferase [Bacteriovoracaceae bacterium]